MCVKINVLYVQSVTTSIQCPVPTVVILTLYSQYLIIRSLQCFITLPEVRKELRDALV